MTRKNTLVDPEGGARDMQPPLDPNSFIFMQFSAKILPNNWFWPKLRGWRPLPSLRYPDPPLNCKFQYIQSMKIYQFEIYPKKYSVYC